MKGMIVEMEDRKRVIKELQNTAERVLELKKEHRQKRPIVIEFSGSPKAGKTSCINSLVLFLKRNGFTVDIVQERASVCPVSDKQSPMFNLWTACMTLAGLIGTLENKRNQVDVLILDRGIFDSLCWFEWLHKNKKMEDSQRESIEDFLLMEELVKCIDIVFVFSVSPNESIKREYATLLTDKLGSIMNEKVLHEYLCAVKDIVRQKNDCFHKVLEIDTTEKTQDEVSREVTTMTLKTLNDLLMEKIGCLKKTRELSGILSKKNIFEQNELLDVLSDVSFVLRDEAERREDYIQPIPVAIITNINKDSILVIKKNKNATSDNSPEKGKTLLYIGGHSRYEDSLERTSDDFISICRSALRREVKEEIGISVALNEVKPFFIYTKSNERSRRHLAVCFMISIDEKSIKLRLDSNELVTNRGKSKSGKFIKIDELRTENELEEWSIMILEHCFNIRISTNRQRTILEEL